MIAVRPVTAAEWSLLRRARLRALEDAPRQFATTLAEAEVVADTEWELLAERCSGEGDALVVLALDGDRPVGMAAIERDPGVRRQHRARVWGVWVDVDSRGRGVGRRLMSALLDWARRGEVVAVYLDVVEGDDPSRSLYQRLGFVRREVDPFALRIDGEFVAQERLVLVLRPPGRGRP